MAEFVHFADTIAAVLAGFDQNPCQYWAICINNATIIQHTDKGTSKAESRVQLAKALEQCRQGQTYTIKLFNKHADNYHRSNDYYVQFGFSLRNENETMADNSSNELIKFLQQQIIDLQAKNVQLEIENKRMFDELSAIDDDDDDDDGDDIGAADPLTKALENPVIVGLIDRIFPPAPQGKITGISGTDAQDEILMIVQQLMNKGVTIDHLRKLAAYPAAKIKMLITML